MSATIKFDRPITPEHFISVGGFSVRIKGFEEPIVFDFESQEAGKAFEDDSVWEVWLRGLDFEYIESSNDFDLASEEDYYTLLSNHLNEISSFHEFYVYTGEYGDAEIIPLAVTELSIDFDGNLRNFDQEFLEHKISID